MSLRLKRLAAAIVSLGCFAATAPRAVPAPEGERALSFYHIHTKETLTVTFKKNGAFVPDAMKKIDWIMRDWRKNQSIVIDPQTIDLIWEMHTELGSKEPVNIICGYRSPATNNMLRRTRGGQASQSQHMTGRAVDLTFPDVPIKRLRYSALIRERGGVGYYPTSGIPFVHVDSSRVRSWPRLPRPELALLFPEGKSRHMPADGGPITREDVRAAQSKNRELAAQIAEYFELRKSGGRQMIAAAPAPQKLAVASLGAASFVSPKPATTQPAAAGGLQWQATVQASPRVDTPSDAAPKQLAALQPATLPKLVAQPKPVERGSRFTPSPTKADRSKLNELVTLTLASAEPAEPRLIVGPRPAIRPPREIAAAVSPDPAARPANGPKVAALMPENTTSITDMTPDALGTGWVQAPAFDEDHPEELAYRPFPLAPLMMDNPTATDPALGKLQHPDVAKTLEMIDDVGAVQPMRFRPGPQVAQVMWAQQFQGKAVHLEALLELDGAKQPDGIENRSVRTSAR